MVHTAQRGNVYEVIIHVALFILLFVSGFLKVWVVVNEGMKVECIKAEELICVEKHDKQVVKKL